MGYSYLSKLITKYVILFICLSYLNDLNGQSCSNEQIPVERIAYRTNGNVDFTIIGDSQNEVQNNDIVQTINCASFRPSTTTTAELDVPAGDIIVKAFLYWSASGGTFNQVTLNGNTIQAQRCWSSELSGSGSLNLYGGFADVTNLVQQHGEGTYTFSGMDNSSAYARHRCSTGPGGAILYGGWALVVFFENPTKYDDFSIYLFDGFKNFQNDEFSFQLQANVFDEYEGAHVGIVAWEGDDYAFEGDHVDYFRLNGEVLPSDGWDVPTNIFNGTDSFEVPTDHTLYNADIDDFDASGVVQDLLNTPAASFNFELRSGMDLILLNSLIIAIPNRAPDATISTPNQINFGCGDQLDVNIPFSYKNEDYASQVLLAGTPIRFYINDQLITSTTTKVDLAPDESFTDNIMLSIPETILGDFKIKAIIDDPSATAQSYGTVLELFEENNISITNGFIDQDYIDLQLTLDLCNGEQFVMGDGTVITTSGSYPFDEKTKRGGCDSIGVLTVQFHEDYLVDLPLETVCEDEPVTRPNGETVTLPPRDQYYTFTDRLTTRYGCDSIVNSTFHVLANQHEDRELQLCVGQEYELADGTIVTESGSYEEIKEGEADNGCNLVINNTINFLNIDFPNAFAPNGNGINEGFSGILPDICPNLVDTYLLRIYNRWGELVFSSNSITEQWPGTFNGTNSDQELYLWYAEYTSTFGNNVKRKGTVTLVR